MSARPRRPLKERARNVFRGQFTCGCSPNKVFRGHRALNAHHLSRHGGYWAGQKARVAGRKIGKQADLMRRHARGWQEAHGLLDHRGKNTAKMRARPDGQVRKISDLRQRHRHGRHADRTDTRVARSGRRENRSTARADRADQIAGWLKRHGHVRPARAAENRSATHRASAAAHRQRGIDHRMTHHQRWPERTSR